MKKAVIYVRTSSMKNVGDEKILMTVRLLSVLRTLKQMILS